MAAAPSIDSVSASLRNCSLTRKKSPPPPPTASAADATVELNSDISLPYHWEQCLDLKTGIIYYINWITGAKSTEDPRNFSALCNAHCYVEDDEEGDDDLSEEDEDEEEFAGETGISGGGYRSSSSADEDVKFFSSSLSASSSSTSSGDAAAVCDSGMGPVLVAAGCPACMMYVMIPKTEEKCCRCGSRLSFFGCRSETRGDR